MQFRTRSIHVGNEKCPETGAVVRPLHLASTYVQPGAGKWGPFDYSRSGNPTRQALEKTLTSLEGGCGALAFASGMAATHSVMAMLRHGDHVVAGSDIYGGTYRLLHKVTNRAGIDVTLVDTTTVDNLSKAMTPATKWVWIESPGNPRLSITDISACAEVAHQHGALLGVDNTFASPVLTRPLELGADLVMHSAAKYLGGHSDLMGGILVVDDQSLWDELYFVQNATGAIMGPLEAFLCARGIKTLELRVREQSRSALTLAQWLASHPRVTRVHYPGLVEHPGHDLAKKQMDGDFGAMLSFELDGDYAAAQKFVESTRLFQLAVSLGAVESLIEQPASMSHASYDAADRAKHGISDGLIRCSVGLEAVEDLQADLVNAFGSHPV
ncbi:MAG: PLP-dependent aspartate aminotransferase family protein [Pirellulales bacterium]